MRSFRYATSALVLTSASLASAQSYRIVDLGVLPGGLNSYGASVNDAGQVAGTSRENGVNFTAFLSGPNGGPLKALENTTLRSDAYGVNAFGQVTGSHPTSNRRQAFLSAPNGGALKDLGTLDSQETAGRAVNSLGQVVGIAGGSNLQNRAFISEPNGGALRDLGALPGAIFSEAYAINESGQVAGFSSSSNGGLRHAFLSEPNGGSLKDLGTLGGRFSFAFGVNDAGQVAGQADLAGAGGIHAFLSAPNGGALQDLGALPGGRISRAYDVNNSGDVVGYSYNANGLEEAFLYTTTGGMRSLNGLLDSSGQGWSLVDATSISDTGLITGTGTIGGTFHAFLLVPSSTPPVPEPATVAALGLAALAALRRRRR